MVRYVDTGSRDPKQALGTWLEDTLSGGAVTALRVQSGFFSGNALGFLESTISQLSAANGVTRLLVGSNNGELDRSSAETLLAVAGAPRSNLSLGIVSFQNAFFHPKVYHFERADGSQAAYVGSANMTAQGARSHHIESGVIVDVLDGDSLDVLKLMGNTIDAWFAESRQGLFRIESSADLDTLVAERVIGVERPKRKSRGTPSSPGSTSGPQRYFLSPLVALPALSIAPTFDPDSPAPVGLVAPVTPASATPPGPFVDEERWSKTLSASDAQRKGSGNQRGAISLVQGDYRGQIHAQTYFRQVFFSTVPWTAGLSRTQQPMDTTHVPMRVFIDGQYLGIRTFPVTHAPNREAQQNNYASTLHLSPIRPEFAATNMTGRKLEIARGDDGSYVLTIR